MVYLPNWINSLGAKHIFDSHVVAMMLVVTGAQELISLELLHDALSVCLFSQRHFKTVELLLNNELDRAGDNQRNMANDVYLEDLKKIKKIDFESYHHLVNQKRRIKSIQSLEYRKMVRVLMLAVANHANEISINITQVNKR